MNNAPFEGDRFSVRPARPDTEPKISEEGVVTGEIGPVKPAEAGDAAEKLLRSIETDARKDAELAEAFDRAEGADPHERTSLVLDRLNAIRRELDASDADPAFKRDRAKWLSDIANRLRELL